jgi:hypothetical protein
MELLAGLAIIAAVSVLMILAMLLAVRRTLDTRNESGSSGSLSRVVVEFGSLIDQASAMC